MAKRVPDVFELRGGPGTLRAFEEVEITSSLVAQSEAKMLLGDDGAWKKMESQIAPGTLFELRLNGRPLFKGRVEANEVPIQTDTGAHIELALRTKFADARYASADPGIKVEKTSLHDFLLALFAQHGYVESDFIFPDSGIAGADLLSGIAGAGAHKGKTSKGLTDMTLQQARVQPPETVFECAIRHLNRHGLSMWDSPDGRIEVGQPSDDASPIYRFRSKRSGPAAPTNNIIQCRRLKDYRDLASNVEVLGQTLGQEVSKLPLRGSAFDDEIVAIANNPDTLNHFVRPIIFPMERAKSDEEAFLIAKRELAARRRRKDGWEILMDGWSYWDGQKSIPYVMNTVGNMEVDAAGGPKGPYLVWRVDYKMSSGAGQQTVMALIKPGLWDLGDAA